PQVTRADLAALIGVRLAGLLSARQGNETTLITDVRNSWAQPWIMSVARAGVMEPYANHAFQPRALVRRSDLAVAAARLLTAVATPQPSSGPTWGKGRRHF